MDRGTTRSIASERNAEPRGLTKTHLSDSVGTSSITTSLSKAQPTEM